MGGGIDHDVLNVLQTALLKAVGRQGPCTAATAREDVVSQVRPLLPDAAAPAVVCVRHG